MRNKFNVWVFTKSVVYAIINYLMLSRTINELLFGGSILTNLKISSCTIIKVVFVIFFVTALKSHKTHNFTFIVIPA